MCTPLTRIWFASVGFSSFFQISNSRRIRFFSPFIRLQFWSLSWFYYVWASASSMATDFVCVRFSFLFIPSLDGLKITTTTMCPNIWKNEERAGDKCGKNNVGSKSDRFKIRMCRTHRVHKCTTLWHDEWNAFYIDLLLFNFSIHVFFYPLNFYLSLSLSLFCFRVLAFVSILDRFVQMHYFCVGTRFYWKIFNQKTFFH